MGMYMSDKTERLNLRLTKEQMEFIVKMSEITGLTPSEYLRSSISATMYGWAKAEGQMDKLYSTGLETGIEAGMNMVDKKEEREVARLENDKTDFNNQLQ